MKIGGMVANMCLSLLIVETNGYDSPRTIKGNLRRILACWNQHCLGSVHPRDVIHDPCVDLREVVANSLPTLEIFLDPSPAHVSYHNHGCAVRRRPGSSTDTRSIGHGVNDGTVILCTFLIK